MYLFCTNVRKISEKGIVGSEQILRVTLVEFIIADKENPWLRNVGNMLILLAYVVISFFSHCRTSSGLSLLRS